MAEIESLVKKLKSNIVSKQKKAALQLITIGEPAVSSIIELLKDKKWYARKMAAFTLGEIKSKDAVSVLISSLDDKHPDVRSQAANALVIIGDKSAIQPLKDKLQKEKKKAVRKLIELSIKDLEKL